MFASYRVSMILLMLLASGPAYARITPAELGVTSCMVQMRDGVRLATDVYLPPNGGPAPVLLMRTPYSREWPIAAVPSLLTEGYVVVLQDTRGRFASEGANLPFDADGQDGYDTIEWIAAQPWCNGKIGMYGGSAMGIAQIFAAATGIKQLTCLMSSWDISNLYEMVYANGLFRQSLVEGWLSSEHFDPQALKIWAAHPTYDDYWRERDATRRFCLVNVPATHAGSWYDIFAQGTIDTFIGFQTQGGPNAHGRQRLLMAPGAAHTDEVQPQEIVFPHGDEMPFDFCARYVAGDYPWFEYHLKGVPNRVMEKTPAVTYYTMGDISDPAAPGNCWRTADTWPPIPTQPTPKFLHADMTIGTELEHTTAKLAYTYDPHNPVPTIGGPQYFLLAGPRDQRSIESRPDVLVFTSTPLDKPLEITGRVSARLWASTDAPDTDFFVRLCDVYPDGRSINICEGGRRARLRDSLAREKSVLPGKIYQYDIDMWSTSIILNKGHQLRVHVTSSCAPGYIANANTGQYPYSATTRIAHNAIYMGDKYPSCIVLPIPKP